MELRRLECFEQYWDKCMVRAEIFIIYPVGSSGEILCLRCHPDSSHEEKDADVTEIHK